MTDPNPIARSIDTQGGSVIAGDVTTGGDFAGRDLYKIAVTLAPNQPFINVPPLPSHTVWGREAVMADLVDRLCRGATAALATDGIGGVGKTTLAAVLARHPKILAHFRGGILWAGLGRTPDVISIQATWGDALGVDLRDLLDPYARRDRLRNAMGAQPLLLVLDDLWQWEAADQLRGSGAAVVHLLTTRDQALARRFAGAQQTIHLDVLEPDPSYALLADLAPEACATDPAVARALAARVDGLPLALELLGGYLAASSHRRTAGRRQQALTTLADPAQRLALATQRLGDHTNRAFTLHETIALSLSDLPAATVTAFHALGAFAPKPARFDLPAALAVTASAEETLITLADRSLVEWAADETFAIHQVLADVARAQVDDAPFLRHQQYYFDYIEQEGRRWQEIEAVYEQIKFSWEWQINHSHDPNKLIYFASKHVHEFQELRGLWEDELRWHEYVLEMVGNVLSAQNRSIMVNNLAGVYWDIGNPTRAKALLLEVLDLDRRSGDRAGEAESLNNLAMVYADLGERQQALDYLLQALPMRRQVKDAVGEATTLSNIGAVYDALGERERALGYLEQALPILRQVGNRDMEATCLNNIGEVYRALGERERALGYYEQALPILRQVGNRDMEAGVLNNIGEVYHALGERERALGYYEQALPILRQVGNRDEEAATLAAIGAVYDTLGKWAQALRYYEQALPILRQVGNHDREATLLNNIGVLYADHGDAQQALTYYELALPLRRLVGNRLSEKITCYNMAITCQRLNDLAQAEALLQRMVELDEVLNHPDLERDRSHLAQVRAKRQAQRGE